MIGAYSSTEIHSIAQVKLDEMDADTLILLDVDETLLIDRKYARRDIDIQCLGSKPFIPIENDVAALIKTMKKINGNKVVLGLTRRRRLSSATKAYENDADLQIQRLHIPLSRHRFESLNESCLAMDLPGICFHNGVIYTSQQDKGMALKYFCAKSNLTFKSIVMIDDKEKNLNSVQAYASSLGIPMTAYLMKGANVWRKP